MQEINCKLWEKEGNGSFTSKGWEKQVIGEKVEMGRGIVLFFVWNAKKEWGEEENMKKHCGIIRFFVK